MSIRRQSSRLAHSFPRSSAFAIADGRTCFGMGWPLAQKCHSWIDQHWLPHSGRCQPASGSAKFEKTIGSSQLIHDPETNRDYNLVPASWTFSASGPQSMRWQLDWLVAYWIAGPSSWTVHSVPYCSPGHVRATYDWSHLHCGLDDCRHRSLHPSYP